MIYYDNKKFSHYHTKSFDKSIIILALKAQKKYLGNKERTTKLNYLIDDTLTDDKSPFHVSRKYTFSEKYLNLLHIYFNFEELTIEKGLSEFFVLRDTRGVIRFKISHESYKFRKFEDILLEDIFSDDKLVVNQVFFPKMLDFKQFLDFTKLEQYNSSNFEIFNWNQESNLTRVEHFLCYNSVESCFFISNSDLLKYFKAEKEESIYLYKMKIVLEILDKDSEFGKNGELIVKMDGYTDHSLTAKWSIIKECKAVINMSQLKLLSYEFTAEKYSKS